MVWRFLGNVATFTDGSNAFGGVVDVVEELYQKQIRIAEEEVVAVVLQHIYGFAAIVIAEKILSQPLIVAGQLVVDECEIVVVSRLTKLLCFFQLLDTCFSGQSSESDAPTSLGVAEQVEACDRPLNEST